MKKNLLFSILTCLFLIQGCAPKGNWTNDKFIPIDPVSGGYIKYYTLGKTKTVFVGQPIMRVEVCDSNQKTIRLSRDIEVYAEHTPHNYHINHKNDILLRYSILKNKNFNDFDIHNVNDQYPTTGMVVIDKKIYYVTKGLDKEFHRWGILVSDDGNVYNGGIYSYDWQQLYATAFIKTTPHSFNPLVNCFREENQSISYELLFTGKNDISINATYKEFTVSDWARPAFFQNLTYQFDAKQIRFKDFLIQIHNVTNEQITYTILEDGLK